MLALALTGCETTAEKSARLERKARHTLLAAEHGVVVSRPSPYVRVVATKLLRSGERGAVAIVLRSSAAHALRDAPIAIAVRDARGKTLYSNGTAGLEAALTHVALLPAGGETTWIDDQVQVAGGVPASVDARVGEGAATSAPAPRLSVSGVRLIEDPASGVGASGRVSNGSAVTQQNLVVYGIARRAGRVVALGRAVLPEVAAHGSLSFELFFVGDPRGARLEMSAPPTSF